MGRVGVPPAEALAFARWLAGRPHLRLAGTFSHLATADEADLTFARSQLRVFREVLSALEGGGVDPGVRHVANTAATLALPDSHLDLVRTGIGIYGLYPSAEVSRTAPLEPAMSWVTEIAYLKEVPAGTPLSYGSTFVTDRPSRIATLPVGYGDGYPRRLSNRGRVLVRGVACPVVGRVCMDMTLADVSAVPGARPGDPVVLMGSQGTESVSADEIARLTGTISYEVTCNVGRRVPRVYRPF